MISILRWLAAAALVLGASLEADAQTERSTPSDSLLSGITARGRALAAYDRAAWLGTDAVLALDPHPAGVRTYLALQGPAGWRVLFGQMTTAKDTFLVAYEATEDSATRKYNAVRLDPARGDTGLPVRAALAIEIARADFGAPNRPYNVAVLPDGAAWFWVYLVPAPTQPGVFPLGGDRRYRVYSFPPQIVDKRQLHRSILEGPIADTAVYS